MRAIPKTAISTLLAVTLAAGASPALAFAGTPEEAMGEEPVAVSQPQKPTTQAQKQSQSSQADGEAAMGEESASPAEPAAPAVAVQGEMTAEEPATGDQTGVESVAATSEEEPALSPQAAASGTWGTCRWEISAAGALKIYPGTAGYNFESPLHTHGDTITSVQFVSQNGQKVKLMSSTSSSSLFYDARKSVTSIDLTGLDTSALTKTQGMFNGCVALRSINFGDWKSSRVTDMSSMFYNCSSLTSLDLSRFDTSSVTDMSSMFYGCSSLRSLDLSSFNTSRTAKMNSMFYKCSALTSLNLKSFNVSSVTDMYNMFGNCSSLRSLDLSSFKASRALNTSSMFYNCSSLKSLDLSKMDTSSVTNMNNMFAYCTSLTSLNVSNLKTSNVTKMSGMFSRCSSLSALNLSAWDTSRVTDMSLMFTGCTSLSSLNVSTWDTSRVTQMGSVFGSCESLASLDLSGWNTSNVTSTTSMFPYSGTVKWLKVGSGYAIGDKYMFPPEPYKHFWKSSATGKLYTRDEIVASRSGIADTYTLVNEGGTSRSTSSSSSSTIRRFPDVSTSAWYSSVVSRAAGLGLINGYKDGRFGPNDKVTRGQVAVILWNMAGKPDPRGAAKSFPDVRGGAYYYDAVRWASSVGVVSGYKNGRFGPNDNVTREQLAAMLTSYAGKVAGKSTSGSAADYRSMKDASSVSRWASSSVGWCFRNKIISGTKDGRVNPKGNATRAETAKMVVFLHDML